MSVPVYIIGTDAIIGTDPDFRSFLTPAESRRMGKMLKRAVVTSGNALEKAGISEPDTVVVATGYGCWGNTESILKEMAADASAAMPTAFMQSTHNTIASALAIRGRWHGYNSTVSNGPLSFECALCEAWIRMQLGKSQTALVGAYEEFTDTLRLSMRADVGLPAEFSDCAAAFVLSTDAGASAEVYIDNILLGDNINIKALYAIGVEAVFVPYPTDDTHSAGLPVVAVAPVYGYSYVHGALGFIKSAESLLSGTYGAVAWVNASATSMAAIIMRKK